MGKLGLKCSFPKTSSFAYFLSLAVDFIGKATNIFISAENSDMKNKVLIRMEQCPLSTIRMRADGIVTYLFPDQHIGSVTV